MPCKGLCEKYKAKKGYGLFRYAFGQKRCQICQIFIRYGGTRCPCCGYKLRASPRQTKYRIKFKAVRRFGIRVLAISLVIIVFITSDETVYATDMSDALSRFYSTNVQPGQIALMWLGHHRSTLEGLASAGFILKTSEHVLAIDPSSLLSDDTDSLQKLDAILITHEHGDHFDPDSTIRMQGQTGATVIASLGAFPALMGKIPEDKLVQMLPHESISLAGVSVTAFPAEHPVETPLFYMIAVDGFSIFHGSDSAFVEDLNKIQPGVHVALVPTGDPSPTASPSDAFEMVKALQPYVVITMHGNPDQMQTLADLVEKSGIQSKVIKPEPLQMIVPTEVVPEFPVAQLIMTLSFIAVVSIIVRAVRKK